MPHCPPQPLLHPNDRVIPKVPLCPATAVVVVCSGQCHPHGGEGGPDGHKWAEEEADGLEEDGEVVDEEGNRACDR